MSLNVCLPQISHCATKGRVWQHIINTTHTTISPKHQIPIFKYHMHWYHQKHPIQEIFGKKCEIHWERNRTHTFTWKLVNKWGRKWRVCVWTRWFWKRERRTRRWIVTRCEGKWNFFETCPKKDPYCAKHAIFATKMSHEQVASNLETKIGKICLSVFRD